MEQVLFVLMLFIVINNAVKLSFWKWWQVGLFSLIAAASVVVMYPYAILQSKTQIADYLQNIGALQNMAILVTAESAIGFGFCVAYLRGVYGKKKPWWRQLLWWYPGLLLFPVLFYVLTEFIFLMTGVSFTTTTYVIAATVLVLLPLIAKVMAWFVPESDLRIELHFLISLFICILGLLSTVNGQTVYTPQEEPINWNAVLLSLVLFAVLFTLGFAWNRIKYPLIQRLREKRSKMKNHRICTVEKDKTQQTTIEGTQKA